MQWRKITDGHREDIYTCRQFGDKQMQRYHEWISVPRDGFDTGNMSLTLKSVQPADEETYSFTVISRDQIVDMATKFNIAVCRLSGLGREGGKLLQKEKSPPKYHCPPADAHSYDPTHHLPTPSIGHLSRCSATSMPSLSPVPTHMGLENCNNPCWEGVRLPDRHPSAQHPWLWD